MTHETAHFLWCDHLDQVVEPGAGYVQLRRCQEKYQGAAGEFPQKLRNRARKGSGWTSYKMPPDASVLGPTGCEDFCPAHAPQVKDHPGKKIER